MTKLIAVLDRVVTAEQRCLARRGGAIYNRHAEHCATCCVLGGKFCRTGRFLFSLAEALETEQLW